MTDLRIDDALLTIELKRGADAQAILDEITENLPSD